MDLDRIRLGWSRMRLDGPIPIALGWEEWIGLDWMGMGRGGMGWVEGGMEWGGVGWDGGLDWAGMIG